METMTTDGPIQDLLRPLVPKVLGALVRRYGGFDACEDAVQEALLAAAAQWPERGIPDDPQGWLLTVASRRLADQYRGDLARRRREAVAASLVPPDQLREPSADADRPPERDDTLTLLFLCCHPALAAQTHTTTSGPDLRREDLTAEAIRLTREVHRLRLEDGEVTGLLALMLLTEARRAARTGPDGTLVPLDEQDRGHWDQTAIQEGLSLVTSALSVGPAGPYLLQAAIAAVHAEAPCAEETDWPQILGLYEMLQHVLPSPVVALNRAVAVAMVHGPRAGLGLLDGLETDKRLAGQHRLEAVRAHLLEMTGDHARAQASYRQAARRTSSLPERRYLEDRAARLMPGTR